MSFDPLEIYLTSVATANRKDKPYYVNTVGTVIAGGASGILNWNDGNRYLLPRISSGVAYYELEVINATTIKIYEVEALGDTTTRNETVTAGQTYGDLVTGVEIELNGSLTTGHKAKVYPAVFPLSDSTFYNVRGTAGDNCKLLVKNTGTIDHVQCSLIIGRKALYTNDTNTPLADIAETRANPTVDTYAVAVTNGSVSGVKYTFTGTLNTYSADNVTAGATGVDLDDSTDTGLTFDSDATAADGDTATLWVSDYADGLQLAPDNAGVPSTWVSWDSTDGVKIPLNRAGYSDKRIPSAQSITVWLRWNGDVTHTIGRGHSRIYTVSYQAET